MSTITERLFALQDLGYKEFHSKLMPTVSTEVIIGVRTPMIRKLAKEIAGSKDAEEFLKILPHTYYEENNLHGCLVEAIKDYDRCVEELDKFLPYVDNWATCDLMTPKVFKKHTEELLVEIERWLASEHTYTVRFGIEMFMKFYLDENFRAEYADMVAAVRSEEYYVNMMIAWYFATALAKQYEGVLPYLTERRLDVWTHNKTIQKALESYRITEEQKAELKELRQRKNYM
ncbi:MAG: DNA alkylation repair protein [Lachnospiraceae bacterium]|nr:DNA alkylation repair protein [Lachnospiraceae bacterium]